jgi:hypothetical protein
MRAVGQRVFTSRCKTQLKANSKPRGLLVNSGCCCDILQSHAGAIEYDDFAVRYPARFPACDNFAKLCVNVCKGNRAYV